METCALAAQEGSSLSAVGVAQGDKGQPGGRCAEGTVWPGGWPLLGIWSRWAGARVSGACWWRLCVGPGSPRAVAQGHLVCTHGGKASPGIPRGDPVQGSRRLSEVRLLPGSWAWGCSARSWEDGAPPPRGPDFPAGCDLNAEPFRSGCAPGGCSGAKS